MLCQAAAAKWETNWESCEADKGFVTFEEKKLPFSALVNDAAAFDPPDPIPLRAFAGNRLSGKDAPRLDVSAKVDGSTSFAGDIRLPDMLYASLRAGPIGDTKLKNINRKAASKVKGLVTDASSPSKVMVSPVSLNEYWALIPEGNIKASAKRTKQ